MTKPAYINCVNAAGPVRTQPTRREHGQLECERDLLPYLGHSRDYDHSIRSASSLDPKSINPLRSIGS